MKILLLEDDLILNEILEEHLIKQKHQITTTFSSNEAIKELYSETFDLLLLDVNVPDLNGFELLKELRDNNICNTSWQIFISHSRVRRNYAISGSIFCKTSSDV